MRLKKGDLVKVITGNKKNKGKIGNILKFYKKKNRVQIENIAIAKKHIKPQSDPNNPDGGIVDKVMTVHISNVMFFDKSKNKTIRIGLKKALAEKRK
jgi:large subunit ribosomal protein L24